MVSRLNRARAARIAELERAYGKLCMCGFLMILHPAHGSDTADWQGKIAMIPKRTHEILQGELKDIKGELKGELKDVKGELKDVKDAQGKLEGELKEIRKVLEDLSDKL
jgi:septal ring factor EnvC (AmiA/AmiB activator)